MKLIVYLRDIMVNKLAIVTLILIGLRISAAEMPVLPYEIVEEIRMHASTLIILILQLKTFSISCKSIKK